MYYGVLSEQWPETNGKGCGNESANINNVEWQSLLGQNELRGIQLNGWIKL